MLVERRHLADDVITNAAGSESILCGIAAKAGVIPSAVEGSRQSYLKVSATGSLDFARDDGAFKGIKLLKKFSAFAGQLVKTDFNCELLRPRREFARR